MVRKEQLIFLFQLAQFSIEIWYSFRLTNTNKHFEGTVRIQEDRNHNIIYVLN